MSGAGNRGGSPFDARVVLAMLLVGALAFLAALYFIGVGDSAEDNDGGAHVGGSGLVGYSAFAKLLQAQGRTVRIARSPAQFYEPGLLVLTPPPLAEAKDINRIVEKHRLWGPTVIILPKWNAMRVPPALKIKARKGWVMLFGAESPPWAKDLFGKGAIDVTVEDRQADKAAAWHGLGMAGPIGDRRAVETATSGRLAGLVKDNKGQYLVSFLDDGGHPTLERLARGDTDFTASADEGERRPVILVADPDLLNNYGMGDKDRAMLALRIVDAAMGKDRLPVVFDLTLNGLGASKNLLALAFTPPFLAATMCLLIAGIVIAWRAFRRFGPPLAEAPPIAFGKRQLALNGAALIQRSGRLHLLGAPYAALARARLARLLGLKITGDTARLEADIGRLATARHAPGFQDNIEALRRAQNPHDLLRRAHALKQIEKELEG